MVLIPKGGGDYRDIGLVGLVWKAVVVILVCHFTAFITYPDSLHGLWAGRGTGTATLDVKLINQVAALRDAVLHAVFLDLHKAYDSLDRFRCLDILEVYDVGPRALRLLRSYWEWIKMVAQVGGYYGEPFCGERGVT